MQLQDMKLPKEKKESSPITIGISAEKERYPFGLCIRLSTEQVKKLGLTDANAEDELEITAKGTITSKRVEDKAKGEKEYNLEIQIKRMGVKVLGDNEKVTMADFIKNRNTKK